MTFDHLVCHRDIPAIIAAAAGDSEPDSTSGTRVTDTFPREVTSVSSNTIRISWSNGHLIRRRDGLKESVGTIPDEPQVHLKDISFPNCINNSGEIPGVERSEVAERLEALGYK